MNHLSDSQLIERLAELCLEQSQIVQLLKQRRKEVAAPDTVSSDREAPKFSVGDRVRVTNSVRIFGRSTTPKDKVGVIERITKSRIHIRTDSSYVIQRAPINVARFS
jgi:hypothetical protein